MLLEVTRSTLLRLVESAFNPVTRELCVLGCAYYDSERDKQITEVDAFAEAVSALQVDPAISAAYGQDNAHRLAIQFVYNTCGVFNNHVDIQSAFETTWKDFVEETSQPDWRFAAVANLYNFSYEGDVADFGRGVSIQGRYFDRLEKTLRWDQVELDRLTEDWTAGGHASSYVLVVETHQPKSPDNFILSSDGTAYPLADRVLLAMRLQGAGELGMGRMLLNRPAAFNVGIGGRSSTGSTIWRPGNQYKLTETTIPKICEQVETLISIKEHLNTEARHIGLAIRSFMSTYDRLVQQKDDCIIDSITALEALWRPRGSKSFTIAFRTSSLLGETDDNRVQIYNTLRKYYSLRNAIVHGDVLGDEKLALVRNNEPLREILRRTLQAFIHLLAYPSGEWTVQRLANDPDTVLLHSKRRLELQNAMGVLRGDDKG